MVEVAVARHSLTWSGPGGVWDFSSMRTKERRNGPKSSRVLNTFHVLFHSFFPCKAGLRFGAQASGFRVLFRVSGKILCAG